MRRIEFDTPGLEDDEDLEVFEQPASEPFEFLEAYELMKDL